jgi:hypothetical protein
VLGHVSAGRAALTNWLHGRPVCRLSQPAADDLNQLPAPSNGQPRRSIAALRTLKSAEPPRLFFHEAPPRNEIRNLPGTFRRLGLGTTVSFHCIGRLHGH